MEARRGARGRDGKTLKMSEQNPTSDLPGWTESVSVSAANRGSGAPASRSAAASAFSVVRIRVLRVIARSVLEGCSDRFCVHHCAPGAIVRGCLQGQSAQALEDGFSSRLAAAGSGAQQAFDAGPRPIVRIFFRRVGEGSTDHLPACSASLPRPRPGTAIHFASAGAPRRGPGGSRRGPLITLERLVAEERAVDGRGLEDANRAPGTSQLARLRARGPAPGGLIGNGERHERVGRVGNALDAPARVAYTNVSRQASSGDVALF